MLKPPKSGFVLPIIIVFLLIILFTVMGSFRVGITSQTYVGKSGDYERAKILAHNTIFDSQSGAVATLLQIESYTAWVGSNCSSKTIGNINKLSECMANYFTTSCTSPLDPNFPKGLCSAPLAGVAATASYSLPLLRVKQLSIAGGDYKPCASYLQTKTSGTATNIPLIDINDAANNGHSKYALEYSRGETGLCALPRYQIEFLSDDYNLNTASNSTYVKNGRIYRVTSRAFGINGNIQVTEQAYFMAQCGNGQAGCGLSLLSDRLVQ